MKKKQIKLIYSKKEKDWLFNFPDNEGNSLAGVFFDMVKTTGHRTDWFRDLKIILTEKGYDYKSFKITCDKIESNE